MSKSAASSGWREARRDAAREAIVDAAWALVREEGLAGLALRDLAKRAGITTPTVYAYFDSKLAIYDAMFGRAATDFADLMEEPYATDDPEARLVEALHRFVDFCTADVARYQLLFQRTIPGFEPSDHAYAPALRSFDVLVGQLGAVGITDPGHIDLWTACTTGLVDQQLSNDPGGDRWVQLIDDMVAMYLAHCLRT
jgi:AcrR family transcriptional regulator